MDMIFSYIILGKNKLDLYFWQIWYQIEFQSSFLQYQNTSFLPIAECHGISDLCNTIANI